MTETFSQKEQTTKRKREEETPQLLPNAKEIKISQDDTHSCENCGSNTNLKDDISETKICEECESCPVCLDDFNKKDNKLIRFSDGCSHKFCRSCSDNFLDTKCPMCRYTPQYIENKIPITSLSYFDTYLKDKKIMPLYKHRIVKENTLISFEYCEKYNRKYKKYDKQLSHVNGKNVKDFVEKALQMKIGTFFIEHYKDRAFNLVHHFNCECCEKKYKIAEY